jgi:uncharacterized delta-60 repeat protein
MGFYTYNAGLIGPGKISTVRGIHNLDFSKHNKSLPGDLDLTFNGFGTGFNTGSIVYQMALQSDGKIMCVGTFTSFNATTRNRILRLNSDGSLDTAFNPSSGFDNNVKTIEITGDGSYLCGGDFTTFQGITSTRIAKINTSGNYTNMSGLVQGFNSTVEVIKAANSTKSTFHIGGQFSTFNGVSNRNGLVYINGECQYLGNVNLTGGGVYVIGVAPDYSFYVGGDFTSPDQYLIKVLSGNESPFQGSYGTIDPFGFEANIGASFPRVIIPQSDGKIFYAGYFGIARLNSDGTTDTSFASPTYSGGHVFAGIQLPDGRYLIGGSFTTINGYITGSIALLNTDGSVDTTFLTTAGSGFNNIVRHILLASPSTALICGDFTTYNGSSYPRIIRIKV